MGDEKPKPKTKTKEREPSGGLYGAAKLLGVAILCFLLGALVVQFRMFPYSQFLEGAFLGLEASIIQLNSESSVEGGVLKFDSDPVTRYEPEKAYDGYTFYSSGHGSVAYLVDMNGAVVHEWEKPFTEVWPDPPHVAEPVNEEDVFWRRVYLYPNGDVIALYETPSLTPWGLGMVKVDRDSNVLWKFADRAHHDFSVHEDGTIFTLTHEFRDTREQPVKGNPQLPSLVLDDFIVQLSHDGDELARVSLLEAIETSDFRHILNIFPDPDHFDATPWDPLHTNTVKALDARFASHHDWAEPGQVIVSMRSFDALATVDMEQRKIVWASRGFWKGQHDPDLLPNGNILLFDNLGHSGIPGRRSRVMEFDPQTNAIEWVYPATDAKQFFSNKRSAQQLLPNGNVLITASDPGYMFEVTREGEAVWVYNNPAHLARDEERFGARLLGATRVAKDFPRFDFNRVEK